MAFFGAGFFAGPLPTAGAAAAAAAAFFSESFFSGPLGLAPGLVAVAVAVAAGFEAWEAVRVLPSAGSSSTFFFKTLGASGLACWCGVRSVASDTRQAG